MSELNPQSEQHLNALADLCCDVLLGDAESLDDRRTPLLKSLLLSGFARHSGPPLSVELENRISDRCREPSMHRGGLVSGMTKQLQNEFDQLKRWESRQPGDESPPKAANISSATDS